MIGEKRLFALRGAAQCKNDPADITEQTGLLYDELLVQNNLAEPDIVSILFSVTPDLDALNPAAALRRYGRAGEASLFAVQEAAAKGSLERTLRVIIHCYLDEGARVRHVYRNGAEVLRPDRR
ncbi:MAG: chorismate mutase [Treponema sp.]|jgi:chorismate mutase|nr:chorismate mutase [Treponema sp.]